MHTLEPFLHPQCFPASLARTCEQHTLLCLQHLDRWLQRSWPYFTVSQCLLSETATRLALFYCLATPKLLTTTRLALCHCLATPRLRAAARLAPFHYLATPRPRAITRWPYITFSQCLDGGLQRAWPCFTVSLHGQIGHILRCISAQARQWPYLKALYLTDCCEGKRIYCALFITGTVSN